MLSGIISAAIPSPTPRIDQPLLSQHVGCRSDHKRLIADEEQALGSNIAQVDRAEKASLTNDVDDEELALRNGDEDSSRRS